MGDDCPLTFFDCPTHLLVKMLNNCESQIENLKEALKLACEALIEDQEFESAEDRHYELQTQFEYFKTMARGETTKRRRRRIFGKAQTDFAIEQLKQVRKWCYDIGEWTHSKYHRVLSLKALDEFINKQIQNIRGRK